ncbi:hypothetical protein EV702DRAFT_677757 [Suillus placidus]|uniref:Uncharacterized protein n=1 Tax=Suillus placidus TaxID=48579 RepID=A0A9P6ZKV7_9AGAM|nr:hypothetical protein EV702DRAFT_677757 [Suillus placidus]
MDGRRLSAESQMLTTTTSPSWQTLTPISYPLTPAMSTSSFILTVTLISTDVVPGPSLQPFSVVDEEPNSASPPIMATIIGGTVIGVTLLALLLTFIVVRSRRRKQKISVTPFNLLSTAEPPQIEPQVWLELRNTSDNLAIPSRPSGKGPSTVQLDSCLAQDSRNGSPSASSRVNLISLQFPNDNDASASTVARRQRSYELEKLYHLAPTSQIVISITVEITHACK